MDARIRILLVDDEAAIREQIGAFLEARGYEVVAAGSAEQAVQLLAGQAIEVALLDFQLPAMNGLGLAKIIRAGHPETIVWMLTAWGTVEAAVEAMKAGVHDYLLKPIDPSQLEARLRFVADKLRADRELASLRELVRERYRFDNMIGGSPAMKRVFGLLESAAQSELPVLISGETGTGKELAARAIHLNGPRRARPFVAINCAAVPEALVESELFGHTRGAFTGASQARAGKIQSAEGGTLLLDELSAAPEAFQAKLLRVIEERAATPVGSDVARKVDVRIIAAMNIPPEEAEAKGRLRRDLLYRLNVLRIDLPPLRDRKEDIPHLVTDLVARNQKPAQAPRQIAPAFLARLMAHEWPGNVRELENVVEASLASSPGALSAESIPASLLRPSAVTLRSSSTRPQTWQLSECLERAERDQIAATLTHTRGVMREAARLLGIDERSLRRKVVKLGIDRLLLRGGSS